MARPIAGDLPTGQPPSPFHTPPNGMPVPAGASPFNYVNQPHMPAPAVPSAPTPAGLLHAFRRRWVLGTFVGGLCVVGVDVQGRPGSRMAGVAVVPLALPVP